MIDAQTPATARGEASSIRVEYFTDPMCCWSWALEPIWRQLRQHYGTRLSCTVVLGGLIESWSSFRDPMNDITGPAQLGPLWQLVGETAGVPIDPGLWHVDPPGSSYPASIAVKAAAQQGQAAGEDYLRLAREGVMTRRLNIARPAVLIDLARELAILRPRAFEVDRFRLDLAGDTAADALRADLQRTRFLKIGRFPTMIASGAAGSRIAVGYRPFDAMRHFLDAVAGDECGLRCSDAATARS